MFGWKKKEKKNENDKKTPNSNKATESKSVTMTTETSGEISRRHTVTTVTNFTSTRNTQTSTIEFTGTVNDVQKKLKEFLSDQPVNVSRITTTSSVKENAASPRTNSTFAKDSIFSPRTANDAAPFKYPQTQTPKPSPTYRSVYTRDPVTSRYTSNPENYTRRLSVPQPKTSSNLAVPTIYKSTSYSSVPQSKVATTSKYSPIAQPMVSKKLQVKVTKTGKFYDAGGASAKIPTYETHSSNRGRVLLINNVKFAGDEQHRKGAEVDEENMISLFKDLGFKIEKHRNKKVKEMETIIKKYKNDSSLKRVDINVVVVMSHGAGTQRSDSTEVVGVDGEVLATTWILQEFTSESCPYLNDKPKIFIFQCCRGHDKDITKPRVEHDSVPFNTLAPRKYADMLIAYSTVPGYVSHRDPETGTWYIQTICEVFMEHAHDTDVENMLKIVDSRLAKYSTCTYSRQTSSYENRGFRLCYLHPV